MSGVGGDLTALARTQPSGAVLERLMVVGYASASELAAVTGAQLVKCVSGL